MMAQNTAVGIRAASGEIHAFGRSRNAAFTLAAIIQSWRYRETVTALRRGAPLQPEGCVPI